RARDRGHLRGRGRHLLDSRALHGGVGLAAAAVSAHHPRAGAEHRGRAASRQRAPARGRQRPLALRSRARGRPLLLILLATGLGMPVPEELPIAIAAMMARWEVMNWWGALLACLGGVLSGDILLYVLGRHFGRRILNWPTARRILT